MVDVRTIGAGIGQKVDQGAKQVGPTSSGKGENNVAVCARGAKPALPSSLPFRAQRYDDGGCNILTSSSVRAASIMETRYW